MDRDSHWSIVEDQIKRSLDGLFPLGAGQAPSSRVEHALGQVAQTAFQQGQSYALLNLLTVEDVAQQLGISPRRVRAIAGVRHEMSGVGWKVPGTNAWLFRPEDVESLRPGPEGYPKGRPRMTSEDR